MKSTIKNIQHSTLDFLIDRIGRITDYREANKILYGLCGINSFFRNQEDFSTLLELLKPSYVVCEGSNRREYGDYQTPPKLSDSICLYLKTAGISPDIVIEPTFGKGSFIISALKHFQKLKRIYGVEIHEPYYWQTKFAILEFFIQNPALNKPDTFLYLDNVFKFNFSEIKRSVKDGDILILGNPPWVTNSRFIDRKADKEPFKGVRKGR